jgi:glycosyltransferase involved in cell wall biosynthesis
MTKKIVFVANNLDVGGPQKGLVALLDALALERFDCTVVSLQRGGDLRPYVSRRARVLDVDDATHALLVNRGSVGSGLLQLLRRGWLRSSALYCVAVVTRALGGPMNPWRQRIWAASSRKLQTFPGDFDAGFAVSSGLATYFLADCVKASRKYHWIIGDYSRTAIAHDVDLSYFRRMTGGLAVSEECAEIFQSVFPELDQTITPFHQLVPWTFYEDQASEAIEFDGADGLKLLTVSRLDPDKGLELAVDACARLVDRGYPLRWVVLGDGAYRGEVERLIAERDVGDAFKLAGFRSNVMDYISAADVFVLPSRSEGRSSAVDEALAHGRPVVVTNYRTASSQVTHGKNGLICAMDANALADSIGSLADPETRGRLADNARRDRGAEAAAANDLLGRLADA